MVTQYGNPASPCEGIERSREFLRIISREARINAADGQASAAEVESGLTEMKAEAAQILGRTCTRICGTQGRCMLESFGPEDPLLRSQSLTPDQKTELAAKIYYDQLSLIVERAVGISLL